jgi:hypothetical protein
MINKGTNKPGQKISRRNSLRSAKILAVSKYVKTYCAKEDPKLLVQEVKKR